MKWTLARALERVLLTGFLLVQVQVSVLVLEVEQAREWGQV